jgi:uncharacterized damage-inducible protein DinB
VNDLLNSVRAILSTTPETWRRFCRALPKELLKQPAAPGQWSALECLHHLTSTEAVFAYRLSCFLEGCNEFPAYDPDSPEARINPTVSPIRLAAEFSSRRAASLTVLYQLTRSDLERRAHHAQLGPVTLSELLHEWGAHDLNHTIQAERAIMQPLIQGSGPWRPYFDDHDLAVRA